MPEIRFYLDENFPGAVAAALRLRGIDVVTVAELQLRGCSDESHLKRAHLEGRVVASRDRDFITLSYTAQPHSGVVYCSMRLSIGELVRGLELIHSAMSAADMVDHLEEI